MPTKIINQLINGKYIHNGKTVGVPIKSIVIDCGISSYASDLISACGLSGRALIVSDVNTYSVLGDLILKCLQGAFSLVFEDNVKPSIENVHKIKSEAGRVDYIVAVGGGTINDLCKYASFLLNKPYVVFGTAPSMNGFSSANASIKVSGHKKTLKAHLPQGIFLDIDVLTKAPIRLIKSGLGDSLCRSTSQADWLLSHLLIGTYYTNLPFELLKGFEIDLFENSGLLINGDTQVMKLLSCVLVLSGIGMYLAGRSYPASQGEHMIAHTMDMAYGSLSAQQYHGEQIAVTTLTMSSLQERILNDSRIQLIEVAGLDSLSSFLGVETAKECTIEYKEKQDAINKSKFVSQITDWSDISSRIVSVMLPYNVLYKSLVDCRCPIKPEDIGWQKDQYKAALNFARFTRNRFTFLDIKSS